MSYIVEIKVVEVNDQDEPVGIVGGSVLGKYTDVMEAKNKFLDLAYFQNPSIVKWNIPQ